MLYHKKNYNYIIKKMPFIININKITIPIIDTTATSNPILQTPFGIWKNSFFSCLNTEQFLIQYLLQLF
jgi:hypothetical protein